jgi:hypothetical protein
MKPRKMREVIGGKRYDTEKATLIAGNDYWDGHNFERSGTNTYLYRTPRGRYFAVRLTCWQGDFDAIEPLSQPEAVELFENLRETRVEFEQAFPDVTVEDA